jgi:hypothetical protein
VDGLTTGSAGAPDAADATAVTANDAADVAAGGDASAPYAVVSEVAAGSSVTVATAADVPQDIAMISSATPVPVADTPVPAPATAPVVAESTPAVSTGDFAPVSFKILSGFKYQEPVPQEGDKPEDVEKRRQDDQIPAEVKSLDGKKAIVEGWMVPMEVNEDGSVKSFVLVKTQPQCCFGDMQAMNEWVDVTMAPGKNAEFNVDLPVKVYGSLEVGEKRQDGFVLSIYRMQGQRVEL